MKTAPNQGKQWTEEERKQLNDLYAHGFSLSDICERLGRTPHGIISQLTQMHLLEVRRDGHYYPTPTEPWIMWQELKTLADEYKPERTKSV